MPSKAIVMLFQIFLSWSKNSAAGSFCQQTKIRVCSDLNGETKQFAARYPLDFNRNNLCAKDKQSPYLSLLTKR